MGLTDLILLALILPPVLRGILRFPERRCGGCKGCGGCRHREK